jgi:protein gp37
MSKTEIAWSKFSWNPVTGCTKISEGCMNCYMFRDAKRLKAMGQKKYVNGTAVTLHPECLDEPKGWKQPQLVFVCSMADLFHHDVPDDFIVKVFAVMRECPQHTFQVLTKRSERMAEFAKTIEWPSNVWAGTTVENNDYVFRADHLRRVPADVHFISAEPLLGPLPDLDLTGIDQLIVGGESGSGWRPIEIDWVRDLRDRCLDANVSFFFKQYAGFRPKKLGRELDGRVWDQMPSVDGPNEDAA